VREIGRGAMKRSNARTVRAPALPVAIGLALSGLAGEAACARGAAPSAMPASLRAATDLRGLVPVHGDADWIKRGGYKDRDGSDCCGQDDCHRLSPAEVQESPGGFNLLGRFIPQAEARPSEDGHYWACYSMFKFRCFFYPPRRF